MNKAAPGARGARGEGAVEGETVAVLDDDVQFIRMIERVLTSERMHIQPITTPDIDEALRVLATARCSAALVDVYMYGESLGFKLVERLREHPEFSSMHVVVTSAARRELMKKSGFLRELGCSVLLKPFEIDELISELSSPSSAPAKPTAIRVLPRKLSQGGADAAGA